jgi:DNA-binding transcriptional regulator YiaG
LVLVQDYNTPLAIPFSELTVSIPLPDKRPFPNSLQTIGDHIKTHRLTHCIPIKEVIAQLGINRETLRGWELGLFEPLVKHYPGISALLGYFPFAIDESSLARKIKTYRFKKGLTQRQFADLLHTDTTTVWQWETRKRIPLTQTQAVIMSLISQE